MGLEELSKLMQRLATQGDERQERKDQCPNPFARHNPRRPQINFLTPRIASYISACYCQPSFCTRLGLRSISSCGIGQRCM